MKNAIRSLMNPAGIALGAALLVAGCGALPDKPARTTLYDFGPGLTAPAAAAAPAAATLPHAGARRVRQQLPPGRHADPLPAGVRRRQRACAPTASRAGACRPRSCCASGCATRCRSAAPCSAPKKAPPSRAAGGDDARHAAHLARRVQPLLRFGQRQRGPGAPARHAGPQRARRRPRARPAHFHRAPPCFQRRRTRRREGADLGQRCRDGRADVGLGDQAR